MGKIAPDEEVCIIELDIEKFFDQVNKKLLVQKIVSLVDDENSNILIKILKNFILWNWSEESTLNFHEKSYGLDIPQGLPQGLVASGFLSNIYLLDFDEKLSQKIGKSLNDTGLVFLDYCRYVDDMRIVIRKSKNIENHVVLEEILTFFNKSLSELNLNLNNNKSKIDIFRGTSGNISKKLNSLNKKLSGPIPFEDIEDQLGHLEALLNLTRVNEKDSFVTKKNWLQQIDKHYFDLREDTVKRFSANKICRVLSEVRHFTSQEVDESGKIIPGDWDFVQERIARRFIALWSEDPSQTLLLKKGIELFPSPQLINPIIFEMRKLLENDNSVLKSIGMYCSSEVFRHVSTVIHNKDELAFPAHSDIGNFFEILQSFAAEIVIGFNSSNKFCFLRKQAEFLLLVRSDSTLEDKGSNILCDFIFKLCNGFRTISYEELNANDIASAILFSKSLNVDNLKLYRGISTLFEKIYNDNLLNGEGLFNDVFNIIVFQNIYLAKEIYYYSKEFNFRFIRSDFVKRIIDLYNFNITPISGSLNDIKGRQSILRIIKRPDNPFANEIMILRVLKEILESDELKKNIPKNKFFDFKTTMVEFDYYSTPPKYVALELNLDFKMDIRFKVGNPSFIYYNADSDLITLHKIATFLRSCIIGEEDWTLNKNILLNNKLYSGIKYSYARRQLGVLTTPEILLGEGAQISNWLTDLLSKMLQLNYFVKIGKDYNWPNKLSLNIVLQLVVQRLHYLKEYYCQLSETPALIEQIELDWPKDKRNLSIAMVQSKMPRLSDLKKYDLYLDNSNYRPQHRKHLTRVCKLVIEQIKAQKVYEPFEREDPKHNNIDILIWPELAVHKDDLDVLINLSRKTKSIIYAGLCYLDQPGIDGPNNCAIWIVPSKHGSNKIEIKRLQGKKNMMALESSIKPWRPYQFFLELIHPAFPNEKGFMITGSLLPTNFSCTW
ncbi:MULTISPECIES: RNA-directed DNA polymerase [Acinetobacter]|uniref:RNA-directed DNA polymerase n=1 Tax=Acinetobacter TaxID=469 RepID=UPI002FD7ABD9